MKRILTSALGLLALCTAALAQVNTVPQVGTLSAIQKQYTYSAVARGLAPAASATDIFCISGSTSRAISIKLIRISGTAQTLQSVPFTVLRRATLDTGGTAATGTALPVASSHFTASQPAASAVLTAYTANPTINDTSPLYFRSQWNTLPVTSTSLSIGVINWAFGELVGEFSRALDIPKSSTQQYCINLNAVTVSSGVLDIDISWTEQ